MSHRTPHEHGPPRSTTNLLLALVLIPILLVLAFALLWNQPWNDSAPRDANPPASETADGSRNDAP